MNLNPVELHRALSALDVRYDPAERMLREPFSSPGYHTAYRGDFTHPTRSAIEYAQLLFDSEQDDRLPTALAVLDRILTLQDTDPSHKTYGIWSWFLEEPLERMSPPDWNWADFIGTHLIQIAREHRSRIPEDLAKALDAGCLHAARSIMRRDVGPGYTNIALMGTHVTYTVGEFCHDEEILQYARQRLEKVYEFHREQGAFSEYNSPTYTALAVKILARMLRDFTDPQALLRVQYLYDIAWSDVAAHYHPPTGQWAGPHSRCYSTLLGLGGRAFFQRATGGKVRFCEDADLPPDAEAHRLRWPCPERFVPQLLSVSEPRRLSQVYHKGDAPVIGRTYMDGQVALGAVNRGTFWNQQRALVAYWGTAEAPQALQVRLLHDGYDFSSGRLFTRLAGPCVLAIASFATDQGDTHPSLDPVKDGTIEAEDLRLRFELQNLPEGTEVPAEFVPGKPVFVQAGNATVSLQIAGAQFGDATPTLEMSRQDNSLWLDVVLYRGARQAIDLKTLGRAFVVFGLTVKGSGDDAGVAQVTCEVEGDRVKAGWSTPEGDLTLSALAQPGPGREVIPAARGIDEA
jgi:hypothetical protein